MFLLDTNVLSELRRPDKTHLNVAKWASNKPVSCFFLSSISVLELELGALLLERKDIAQAAIIRTWINEQVLPQFEGRILAIDTAVALRCARLHVPNPHSERDALIAATALVHSMTVVTRNIADFETTGVRIFNPWGA